MLDKREKYFIIDFRTHTDKVTIDRLKSAQLSLDTLNQDVLTNSITMSPSTQPPYTFNRVHNIHDTHWPIGETAYSPGRLHTLISEALVVTLANCHRLIMFNCATKSVLVNAIVCAVNLLCVCAVNLLCKNALCIR